MVMFFRQPVTFVKELIYRSLERNNLDTVYRQIQELRKRLRTREQKAVGPRVTPFLYHANTRAAYACVVPYLS